MRLNQGPKSPELQTGGGMIFLASATLTHPDSRLVFFSILFPICTGWVVMIFAEFYLPSTRTAEYDVQAFRRVWKQSCAQVSFSLRCSMKAKWCSLPPPFPPPKLPLNLETTKGLGCVLFICFSLWVKKTQVMLVSMANAGGIFIFSILLV